MLQGEYSFSPELIFLKSHGTLTSISAKKHTFPQVGEPCAGPRTLGVSYIRVYSMSHELFHPTCETLSTLPIGSGDIPPGPWTAAPEEKIFLFEEN